MSTEEDQPDIELLLPYVPEPRRKEFVKHIHELCNRDEHRGDIDPSFLGFMRDYFHYSKLLNRKADVHDAAPFLTYKKTPLPPITIYDVGCCTALQHLFFDPRLHYVGIDRGLKEEPRFFRDNCTFVKGRFLDVVESLKVDKRYAIGIANMSLLYCQSNQEELDLFDRTFRQKFIL